MDCAKPLNLLVVEDDTDDFFLVDELLRSQLQARTQLACSVDEAILRISQSKFDVILLDYALGAKTGLDLLEHV
jgi:CheY-like chemotaxis protein